MHCTQKCCSKSTIAGDCNWMRRTALLTAERICILNVATTNVRGGFFPNIGSTGGEAGRFEGATAEKAVPFPRVARRSQFLPSSLPAGMSSRVQRGVKPPISHHAGCSVSHRVPRCCRVVASCLQPELSRCAKTRPLSGSALGQPRFRAGGSSPCVTIAVADTGTHSTQRNYSGNKEQRADSPKTTGDAANS